LGGALSQKNREIQTGLALRLGALNRINQNIEKIGNEAEKARLQTRCRALRDSIGELNRSLKDSSDTEIQKSLKKIKEFQVGLEREVRNALLS
jgi:hypothetical protein